MTYGMQRKDNGAGHGGPAPEERVIFKVTDYGDSPDGKGKVTLVSFTKNAEDAVYAVASFACFLREHSELVPVLAAMLSPGFESPEEVTSSDLDRLLGGGGRK